jgi:hypothetical protein
MYIYIVDVHDLWGVGKLIVEGFVPELSLLCLADVVIAFIARYIFYFWNQSPPLLIYFRKHKLFAPFLGSRYTHQEGIVFP